MEFQKPLEEVRKIIGKVAEISMEELDMVSASEQVKERMRKDVVSLAEDEEDISLYGEITEAMRPVIDSYKDRDYKQLDRNLVYAAVDMIV